MYKNNASIAYIMMFANFYKSAANTWQRDTSTSEKNQEILVKDYIKIRLSFHMTMMTTNHTLKNIRF